MITLINTISFVDLISILSNVASILTAIIAFIWFFYSKKLNYFEKENINGCYKAYETLRTRAEVGENDIALIEISISNVSSKGWFVGTVKYSEIFRPVGARSEGSNNLIGYINYNFINDLFAFLFPRTNPLKIDKSKGYKGKLYVMSRNDFDIANRNWKDFLIETYEITHYRNSFRLSLTNKSGYMSKTQQSQLPESLLLINTDIVKDSMYEMNTRTEVHLPSVNEFR